jgi:hypothetical protein
MGVHSFAYYHGTEDITKHFVEKKYPSYMGKIFHCIDFMFFVRFEKRRFFKPSALFCSPTYPRDNEPLSA